MRARVTKTLRTSGLAIEVEIALAIARLHVFQAMPLFGHGEQRLGKELQLFGVDAQFAGAGAEEVAVHADDVADIEQLEELIIALAHGVLLHVDLQTLAVLLEVGEAGLAHVAQGHEAAGDADAHFGGQLFGGLGAVRGQNLGNGMGEIEPAPVGAVSQRFDLADAGQALLE